MTLSRWEKKKKKHFPASESSFFHKYLCETLQRNKTYFLLIAKIIHLVILMLQASGGRPYFQTFIQFPWFPIQNHCPGAFVTYFCFVVFFLLLLFTKCSSISWEPSTLHWHLNEDAGLACLRHELAWRNNTQLTTSRVPQAWQYWEGSLVFSANPVTTLGRYSSFPDL